MGKRGEECVKHVKGRPRLKGICNKIEFQSSRVAFHLIIFMNQSAIEIISARESIPEFIMKIYKILEKQEYHDIISWNADNNQIVIKDTGKLENHVLPNFFRHQKLRSFIRQLNMYRFRKVARYNKQIHMHFKHQHFVRGNMYQTVQPSQNLILIKRRKRNSDEDSDEDSAERTQTETLEKYRQFVRTNIQKIQQDLAALAQQNPHLATGLRRPLQISNLLIGEQMNSRLDILLDRFVEPCTEWLRLMKSARDFDPHLSMDCLQSDSLESGHSLDHVS